MTGERIHLLIAGRVQGVCFRSATQARARALGATGWVRNLLDGRVEIVAEGTRAQIEALTAFCREGPTFARVDDLEILGEPYVGEFSDFRVVA